MKGLAAYLPFGLTPVDVLAILCGATAFFVVVAVWQALRARDPVVTRAKSILTRRKELMAQYLNNGRERPKTMGRGFMAQTVSRFRLLQGQKTNEIREHLAQAGLRSREALIAFLFFKLCLPLVFGAAALILFKGMGAYNLSSNQIVLASIGSVLFGAYAPTVWVRNLVSKRQNAFRLSIPDALDLLVICVEAGLSLDAALARVSRELGKGSPELGDEFQLTSLELGLLPDRRLALENLSKRVPQPSIRAITSALLQTEKYGTPLAQSLLVLAAEFRNDRMMRAEEKAARLPATMTVPMVIFILPTLFIVLIGPAVINVMDTLIRR